MSRIFAEVIFLANFYVTGVTPPHSLGVGSQVISIIQPCCAALTYLHTDTHTHAQTQHYTLHCTALNHITQQCTIQLRAKHNLHTRARTCARTHAHTCTHSKAILTEIERERGFLHRTEKYVQCKRVHTHPHPHACNSLATASFDLLECNPEKMITHAIPRSLRRSFQTLVHQCRKLLAPSLAAYVSESYDRAYYSVAALPPPPCCTVPCALSTLVLKRFNCNWGLF